MQNWEQNYPVLSRPDVAINPIKQADWIAQI